MGDIYLLEGARTAFGTFGGAFKDVSPTQLGVTASKGAIARSGISPWDIEFSVTGNVIHTSSNASYLARHIALGADIPVASPALSINRLCGSGLQAVITAAQTIRLQEGRVGLACGTENMSMSPYVLRGSRFGTGLASPQLEDMLWATLTDEYCGTKMGITAENLAEKYGISREEQDAYALVSQQRAASARSERKFEEEIVPIEMKTRKGVTFITEDEHIREDTTLANLSKLKPAFKAEGTVTAGNASGINDGAGAFVLADESFVIERGLKPLARIVSWGITGVDPQIMGIGPVPAIKLALQRANLSLQDMHLIEVNEAFAAQYLAVEKELELDRTITNVNGGAIALGHPVGASGARILYTLIRELKRRNRKYGVASLCIGGGQGIAAIVEVV